MTITGRARNRSTEYKGKTFTLSLSNEPSVAELQAQIELLTDVKKDSQRLFQKRRRVDCSDISRPLSDVCDCSDNAASLLLMAGASTAQIEDMKATQSAVQEEMRIRENRRVVDISKRNRGIQARDAVSTNYRFHAIEPLKNFADADKAQGILEKLANDRGILAVMAKHKWSVGVLAEMPPDGKVGVDPVCVLGLNQNKGQKILLRLRTDDLLGFRKFISIKKVLFHELSHNVHSEHDNKFYQLMRQVEKECNELDWTHSGGAAVGGSGASLRDDGGSGASVSNGHRLGGGSAVTSRLLNIAPPSSTSELPSPVQTSSNEKDDHPATNVATEDIEMKDTEVIADEVSPVHQTASLQDPKPDQTMPEVHEQTVDEEVATLAMSDRERRIHDAVSHLQAHYSGDTIFKAVSLLYKIVSNIITHPADVKFRSIRKANRLFEGQVARFPECLEFLLALGFEDQPDKFVLVREDPALLWIGRSTLEVLLPAAA
ncbi:Ubiquitin and WLM domain-containing metalloprotease [Phytophthora citrophthora]|uniref:Ubiquitin and WLM domain-containing metalloprotease n=1 Tax=Phytophthora citrophthora TaxID=4793 RepID=A0AAD9LNN4_9STRA|nr:Ubiquitin and WLM domain-containing metalloprotease [Phytophthora citrophthora]